MKRARAAAKYKDNFQISFRNFAQMLVFKLIRHAVFYKCKPMVGVLNANRGFSTVFSEGQGSVSICLSDVLSNNPSYKNHKHQKLQNRKKKASSGRFFFIYLFIFIFFYFYL